MTEQDAGFREANERPGDLWAEQLGKAAAGFAAIGAPELSREALRPIYVMASEDVLSTYEQSFANKRQIQWLRLVNILEEAPISSLKRYPYHNEGGSPSITVPEHYGLFFESTTSHGGIEMRLNTHVKLFADDPNNERFFNGLHFKDFRYRDIGWLSNAFADAENAGDWLPASKPYRDEVTGVNSQRLGLRKHLIPHKEYKAALHRMKREWLQDIFTDVRCVYLGVVARPLQGGEGKTVLSTAIAKKEFVEDEYTQFLPRWEWQRYPYRTHPLFADIEHKPDLYGHFTQELPAYLPDDKTSIPTLDSLLGILSDSYAECQVSVPYFSDEDYKSMFTALSLADRTKKHFPDTPSVDY